MRVQVDIGAGADPEDTVRVESSDSTTDVDVWRTADRIWQALGDTSTDENYYSKRAILSGVLASTYAKWLSDESPDNEETWAFLNARIENVMQFEKFKAQLKPISEGVQSAVGVAARFRYGR